MERANAIEKITELIGKDIRPLADEYGVTVWLDGKKNKGWAGHVIERHLGLPLNSSRAPNFGSWELKVVPLKYDKKGVLKVKETMAITMLDPVEVVAKEFEESHLYNKLRKILVVSRIFENIQETSSVLHSVQGFDLENPETLAAVKQDYETVREALNTVGFASLTGRMGVFVQPRTKGQGHGSTSRAFYARTGFVAHILRLQTGEPIVGDKTEPLPEETAP